MSAGMLFLILLVIGVLSIVFGTKCDGKAKIILLIIGVLLAVIGGYGVFTALL